MEKQTKRGNRPMKRRWCVPIRIIAGLFITVFLLIFPAAAGAQGKNTRDRVIAVIPPDAPPTYFRNAASGRADGFSVDIMSIVAERAGLQVEYVFEEGWKDIIAAVERGRADVAPLAGISEERRTKLDFTTEIDVFPIVFFVHSHTSVSGWSPGNRTVGVISGSLAYEKLRDRPDIRFQMYDSFVIAMHDLLSGKIAAFACPAPIFLRLAQDADLEDHFRMIEPPIDVIHRAIAVRKGDTALLDRINPVIKDFVGSAEYQHIYRKWYGSPPPPFWTPGRIAAAGGRLSC